MAAESPAPGDVGIAEILASFTGAMSPYASCLRVAETEPVTLRGDDMVRGSLGPLLSVYARSFPPADQRAVASMWSQYFFGAVLLPILVARLTAGCSLPVALADLVLVPHEEGRIAALALPEASRFRPEPPERFVQDLLAGQVEPLGRALAEGFGVGRRVIAVNAAILTEWVLGQCVGREDVDSDEAARLRILLFGAKRPDGSANPLHGAIATTEAGVRRRRVCCLRYLLPGMADCGDLCPLVREG